MMELTEQSWTSDNTLPPARLQIQEGYSQLFPASTMAAWVTDEEKDA
jgi:alpha-galactosidase